MNTERQDVYTRITNKIVADLEQGVRTWMKPWNAGNTAGRITRPLRHNGQAYSGINVLMLWASAVEQGFSAPTWMTFQQALELKAHVRKGEKGSLVIYTNTVTRTEASDNNEETERTIRLSIFLIRENLQESDGEMPLFPYIVRHGGRKNPINIGFSLDDRGRTAPANSHDMGKSLTIQDQLVRGAILQIDEKKKLRECASLTN
jgi:hypothetical protein